MSIPNAMRSLPSSLVTPHILRQAQAEWAGTLATLEPKLSARGIKLIVESHPDSRLHKPDAMGRKLSACPADPDWLTLVFEDVPPDMVSVLKSAGAADPNTYGVTWLYYEQHILECCSFAQNLSQILG